MDLLKLPVQTHMKMLIIFLILRYYDSLNMLMDQYYLLVKYLDQFYLVQRSKNFIK